ncbi:MAG: hypothetical protein HOY71_05615 [Nonomuraea sp.]|nr:hypothetical protein [Nonomuraea sp.]
MLTMTDNAVEAINDLTEGEDAGLRIASKPEERGAVILSLTNTPEEGDQVIEQGGARVFLEPDAAELLGDRTLDAEPGSPGHPTFRLDRRLGS